VVPLATCALKKYLRNKSLLLIFVCVKFLPPERIKYLYNEKLLTGSDWCVDFSLIVHPLISSIQLLGHSMGRLHPWVFHAKKVPLGAGAGFRVVNGPHFQGQRPEPEIYFWSAIWAECQIHQVSEIMCIACLSTVMRQNVIFLKKKSYHETIKDCDMVLQNELSRIAL